MPRPFAFLLFERTASSIGPACSLTCTPLPRWLIDTEAMPPARERRSAALKVWLGHGASGGPETMQPYIRRLRSRGVDAHALRLPRGAAERAMGPLREQVGADLLAAVIGGHSFGGRVASMVAAETPPAGLVLLSYPLHRPGHPEELRASHWSAIACPVLVLSGDRDQFARAELLREAVRQLPRAQLHLYPGMRHGLTQIADDVARRIADFVASLQ
jgi:pimeloyl-ACP methyl ester carboxylesterase